jgi:hypothetical protein
MYEDLTQLVGNLEKGLDDCENSDNFKKILKVVLNFGNFLNHKTKNGDAKAFKLGTLRKLRDNRSTIDAKTTLLHFLVDVVETEIPDCMLFTEELQSLELASKVPISKIRTDLTQMSRRMEAIATQLEKTPAPIEERFFEIMAAFRDKSNSEIQDLRNRYSSLEKRSDDFVRFWGEDPSAMPVEEFLAEVLFFVGDFKKAKEESERRRQLEKKRRDMEEKKRQAELEKANRSSAAIPSAPGAPPPPAGPGGLRKRQAPPQRNAFGREMGPLDMLFSSINSGNFNLKKTPAAEPSTAVPSSSSSSSSSSSLPSSSEGAVVAQE